jgi:hypothetical protein
VVQRLVGQPARGLTLGATVERGQPLSDHESGAATLSIALSERLGCPPRDVERLLTKPVGSRFEAGEEIANGREGLRGQSVAAPFAGTLRSYNPNSGLGVFVSSDVGDNGALVSGVVVGLGGEFVTIETSGSRVFGIVGVGRTRSGPIQFLSSDPDHVPSSGEIVDAHRGAVVIAGPWVSADVMRRLCDVNAAAVISGGFAEAEIAEAFNLPDNERISAWRVGGRRFSTPMAVVATEGFGQLPIHPAIWSFFEHYQGREALIIPETSLLDGLARPRVIVADTADETTHRPKLVPGAHLRLIDPSNLGQAAMAISEPFTTRDHRGCVVEAIEVRWPNGRSQVVPISTVELIA